MIRNADVSKSKPLKLSIRISKPEYKVHISK